MFYFPRITGILSNGYYTILLSLANFVGSVVGFLKRIFIRVTFRLYVCGASSSSPRYPLTGCATEGRAIKIKLFLPFREVTPNKRQLQIKTV